MRCANSGIICTEHANILLGFGIITLIFLLNSKLIYGVTHGKSAAPH